MCDISAPALEKALAKVKEIVPNAAGKIETTICDVSKEADVAATVEKVDPWGGLDVMFNNAGIMHADDAGEYFARFPSDLLKLTRLQMPSTPQRRSGISLTTSTSRVSGLAQSTQCRRCASTTRPRAPLSTLLPSSHWSEQQHLNWHTQPARELFSQ
jgi:NAD(P)-dependent dehydrogenase (short-subunit alcohol dehydrogenase family)